MREYTVYCDVNSRKAYLSANEAISADNAPYMGYKERIRLTLQLINSSDISDVYTGLVGINVSCEASVKNTNKHYFEGALTAAKSGSVIAISADGFTGEDVYDTGLLYLRNAARQSETVAYTAYSFADGIYTFTVSKTLTNSYANNDICRIIAHSLIAVENSDIDQTDKDTGKFVIELYSYTQPYQRAVLNKWEIPDCKFGFYAVGAGLNDELGMMIDFRCFGRLIDNAVIPPPPDDEDYYTKTEDDAKFISKQISLGGHLVNVSLFCETGNDGSRVYGFQFDEVS